MRQITTTILGIAAILAMLAPAATAEDAPAMWMVQTDEGYVDLMVNTSEPSSGANAWIYFDPECIGVLNVSFENSPWQPMIEEGFTICDDHVVISVVNFEGVPPGEYHIARLTIGCVREDCTSILNITKAEPIGVKVYNTTYTCGKPTPVTEAVIAIGDGTGTVTLPITIKDCKNVGAVDVTLSFDPRVVNVTGVSDGAMDCTYTNLEHLDEGWIRVGAIQGDNPGLSGEFTLLNVDFVPVSSDEQCSLGLSVTTFKDATPDCTAMDYVTSEGTYTASKNGDVNGDGEVDMADAMSLAKYVIGIAGYETINEGAADVNGDGNVDLADSMYLTKHVLGIEGYETLR